MARRAIRSGPRGFARWDQALEAELFQMLGANAAPRAPREALTRVDPESEHRRA